MYIIHYINQFRGSRLYQENAVDWIMENVREDGVWDWGTQVNLRQGLDMCNKKCYYVCNKKCCGGKYDKGYLYQMLSVESKV